MSILREIKEMVIGRKLREYHAAAANLGLPQFAFYAGQRVTSAVLKRHRPYQLFSKQLRFTVLCRSNTSDINVFNQIFLHREYRCLDDLRDVQLIVDCGANVGYSSAYFLSRFPGAHVVAVEPDPDNFSALLANLAPYRGRYTALRSGIWSHPTGLVLAEGAVGDGREWARTVREAGPGEKPMITATDVAALLENSGFERISILKMDIEGSEKVVFSSNFETWLEKVDNLVIECHGKECVAALMRATNGYPFTTSRCDELFVFKQKALRHARSATYSRPE